MASQPRHIRPTLTLVVSPDPIRHKRRMGTLVTCIVLIVMAVLSLVGFFRNDDKAETDAQSFRNMVAACNDKATPADPADKCINALERAFIVR